MLLHLSNFHSHVSNYKGIAIAVKSLASLKVSFTSLVSAMQAGSKKSGLLQYNRKYSNNIRALIILLVEFN